MAAEQAVVYLDTNCFIVAIEGRDDDAAALRGVFSAGQGNPGAVATSELTIAEVMAGVEGRRRPHLKRLYLNLLISGRFVDLRPVSRDLLFETAKIRAVHPGKLKLPDAIHLATAIDLHCRYFMSGDLRLATPIGGPMLIRPNAEDVSKVMKEISLARRT